MNTNRLKILFLAITLIAITGCRNCVKPTPKIEKVTSCHVFNGHEKECNMATQTDHKKCHFDRTSQICMAMVAIESFNCGSIELKDACNAQLSCQWNVQHAVCESKPMP
jgi:hypothetical protein